MDLGPLEFLLIIVGISILVIVHESGHYFAARAFGMRVKTYSIGFGPTIFKYQKKGSPTLFKVCAIPFLAYVEIAGMNPHEDVDPQDPELFPNKSLFARITTIAAGPLANYLTASIFIFALALAGWPMWLPGTQNPHGVVVKGVIADSASEAAGLQPGDHILEANGETIGGIQDLKAQVEPRAGRATPLVVSRNGERMRLEVTPLESDEGKGFIGVEGEHPVGHYLHYDAGEAAAMAFAYPWELTRLQLKGISKVVSKGDTKQIGGPVKMGQMIGGAAQHGPLDFFAMLVLLNVALGMFNLLPLPALDGGRLMFLGYEVVTRRRANERLEAMVHTVGIIVLLGVIALVTVRDIREWSGAPDEEAAEQGGDQASGQNTEQGAAEAETEAESSTPPAEAEGSVEAADPSEAGEGSEGDVVDSPPAGPLPSEAATP